MKKLILATMAFMIVIATYAAMVIWHLETEKSLVSFNIKNFGRKVDGTFSGMKADIKFDEKNPEKSSFSGSIPVNTINTGIKKRDRDLMSDNYFAAEKYPTINFKSKSASKTANGYLTKGDLTIKGVTKEIEIPFTFKNMGDHGEFIGTLSLNRHDYNIGGKTKIMGDQVDIQIKADVNK
jgi:polyisoprenoid-binding protein YceI